MIALLAGILAFKSFDHIIVDVGGVGYRLFIPLSTYYALPEGGEVRLHVHTHVREEAFHLFGFVTPAEKELFGRLLAVSGIGPKLAVNILSHIQVSDLRAALASGNVKHLATLPGIGKKTAERLVLELKEKMQKAVHATQPIPTEGLSAQPTDTLDDILSALVNLGYKEAQARKVLDTLEIPAGSTLEEVLKSALRVLVR